jgi:hypothetical protein
VENIEEESINSLIKAGKTHKEVSYILQTKFPSIKERISEETVRKYSAQLEI